MKKLLLISLFIGLTAGHFVIAGPLGGSAPRIERGIIDIDKGDQKGERWSTTVGAKGIHDVYVTLKFDPAFSKTPVFLATAYGQGRRADVWVMSASKDTFECRFNMPMKRSERDNMDRSVNFIAVEAE